MRRKLALITVAVLGAVGLVAAAPAPMSETERNRVIVTDVARMFYTDRTVRKAFETYVVPDYIQHNLGIGNGREAAIVLLEPKFSNPTASFEIKRILVDGDMAMIHLHARPDPQSRGGAVADIYRLQDGKIVEHWDVLQPVPEHSANPHPMF